MITWLLDILLGPACQMPGCNYRARGWRTFQEHMWGHADEVTL